MGRCGNVVKKRYGKKKCYGRGKVAKKFEKSVTVKKKSVTVGVRGSGNWQKALRRRKSVTVRSHQEKLQNKVNSESKKALPSKKKRYGRGRGSRKLSKSVTVRKTALWQE